jgi:hypothetical protein
MEKWSHRSLEWIHQVREQNYNSTLSKTPEDVTKETLKDAQALIKALNLKLIYPVSSLR